MIKYIVAIMLIVSIASATPVRLTTEKQRQVIKDTKVIKEKNSKDLTKKEIEELVLIMARRQGLIR